MGMEAWRLFLFAATCGLPANADTLTEEHTSTLTEELAHAKLLEEVDTWTDNLFPQMDKDRDWRVSEKEMQKFMHREREFRPYLKQMPVHFKAADLNNDTFLEEAEFKKWLMDEQELLAHLIRQDLEDAKEAREEMELDEVRMEKKHAKKRKQMQEQKVKKAEQQVKKAKVKKMREEKRKKARAVRAKKLEEERLKELAEPASNMTGITTQVNFQVGAAQAQVGAEAQQEEEEEEEAQEEENKKRITSTEEEEEATEEEEAQVRKSEKDEGGEAKEGEGGTREK